MKEPTDKVIEDSTNRMLDLIQRLSEEGRKDDAAIVAFHLGLTTGLVERAKRVEKAQRDHWIPFGTHPTAYLPSKRPVDPLGPEELRQADVGVRVDTTHKSGHVRRRMHPSEVVWADVVDPVVGWRFSDPDGVLE